MNKHNVRKRATFARAVVILFLASTITAGITAGPGGAQGNTFEVCPSGCDYSKIQTAIDVARAGDIVLVGPGTYAERLHIPASKSGLSLIAQQPGTATVNASEIMDFGSILFVSANNVLVRGLDFEWDGTSESSVNGVWLSKNGVRLEDNTIRLGGSTKGQLTGIHIQRASNLEITGNTVESDLVDLDELTTHTANGVYVQGGTPAIGEAKDLTFADNTFSGWATRAIFLNGAEATRITGNSFLVNNEGVLLCNTKDTLISHNTFHAHFTGVQLCDSVQDPVLHKNALGLTNQVALLLDDRITSITVDARLNDWGLYNVDLLGERIDDQGTGNQVLQVPFLDAQGAAEPPLVRIQDRPDEPFFTVQDALDATEPGDIVLVPASGDFVSPLARQEAITMNTPGIILCSSIGGSPLCAEAHEPGHWQLSRGEWIPAPTHGHGSAILLDDEGEAGTWGSTSFFPPDGLRVDDLQAISLDLFLKEANPDTGATCGAGSPRIAIGVDASGDGQRDGTITITETGLQSGCDQGEWIYADYMDESNTQWGLHTLGGPNGVSRSEALAWIDDNLGAHEILAINAIMDNGATAVIDNQRINDWVLGEPQDIGCYWTQGLGCRWEETRSRTVLDAQGAATTLSVDAAGIQVHGFTIRNTGDDVPLTGVLLKGDNALLRDNDIHGNFLPLGHDGGPTVNQIGVEVGAAGARDGLVQDNLIRGWDNIGVLLHQSAGSGNQILANTIKDNRWHGILAEGPTADKGNQSAEIRANTIANHGHSSLRIGTTEPGVLLVRENTFSLTNVNAVTIQDRVENAVIDVRLNDWGLYDHLTIHQRVDDESGTNRIDQVPFLDATGSPEPPMVQRVRPESTHPLGTDDLFLSFQEAIDDPNSVPGTRVQGKPSKTPYPGPIELDRPGITLCGTLNGTTCDGEGGSVVLSGGSLDKATLTLREANITIQRLTLLGGNPVVLAESAPGLLLRENLIITEKSATSATDGVRITDSDGAHVASNQITGNLYPQSGALILEQSDDVVAKDNRIVAAATGIQVLGGHRALLEGNQVLATPSLPTAGETTGIRLETGADHTSMKNTIFGAGTGLVVIGATDATSEADQMLATVTGVRLGSATTAGPPQQPDGFRLHNASLATTLTALHLSSGTIGLDVDATCNDWGAYNAAAIETLRITDDGTNNQVGFTPYIAPAPEGPLSAPGCLVPPIAEFTHAPQDPEVGESVQFQDNSSQGSRPIQQKEWDFGDGTTLVDTFPYEDPQHAYDSAGVFLVTLRVTDTDGNSATSVAPVLVDNQPPEIVAPFKKTARAGNDVNVPVRVVDLGSNLVTLTATGLPEGAELNESDTGPNEWEIRWTPGDVDAGTYEILLTAMNTAGKESRHLLELVIWNALPAQPKMTLSKQGVKPGPAMPDQPLTFQARLINQDSMPIDFQLEATTVAGWATAIHGDDVVTLAPGERRIVWFDVIVGDGTASSSFVHLIARPIGTSDGGLKIGWNIRLPVDTNVVMTQASAGDDITGTVTVTFKDGSPAVNRPVRIERTYDLDPIDRFTSHLRGDTDQNGTYRFTLPTSDHASHLPGSHTLVVDVYSPVRQTTVMHYTIGPSLEDVPGAPELPQLPELPDL